MKIDPLSTKFNSIPEEDKIRSLSKLQDTILLGIRALVVENLDPKDKEEFEKVASSGSDDDILLFGANHIPGFTQKLENLKQKVYSAFKEEIAQNG